MIPYGRRSIEKWPAGILASINRRSVTIRTESFETYAHPLDQMHHERQRAKTNRT